MAVDKSLKTKGSLLRRRNVLSREERLQMLEKDGRWQDGDSVFGLPKVALSVRKVRKKTKEPAAEAAVEAPSEGADTEAKWRGERAPAS